MGQSVKYDESFKKNAVGLVESGQSAVRVAADLGIPVASLYQWMSRYRQHPARHKDPLNSHHRNGSKSRDERLSELESLRKENELLRMERDILKKAVGIFSLPPR